MMASQRSPLRRYISRKIHQIRTKYHYRRRQLTKNGMIDQQRLFAEMSELRIFDVGANIGGKVARYRKLFPDASIHCFEPYPSIFAKLQTRFEHDSRVFAHCSALADVVGTAELYVSKADVYNSLLKPIHDRTAGFDPVPATISVPTSTFDEYCKQAGISDVHILKLDVQGSEIKVLNGAQKMLASGSIWLIYIEIQIIPIYENQPLFNDLMNFFYPFDYQLFNVYDLRESGLRQLNVGDAIFTSLKLRQYLNSKYGPAYCGW